MRVRPAGARRHAAPLVVCAVALAVGVTGCSSSSSSPAAAANPTATAPTTPPSADATGLRLLARAEAVLAATRSYSFVADTTIAAASTVRSHLVGRVVRDQGLAYTLTVRSKTTQVVRLRTATYLRVVPNRWARLRHPHALANPTATLLAVLRAMTPSRTAATANGGHTVYGSLGAAGSRAAGLPSGANNAAVTVVLDSAGHVLALSVNTTLLSGTTQVRVDVRTRYANFGKGAPIRKPA